eukprot:COSAG01_NODE_34646_length_544_cov_0.919101_1_plen_23_part_01
MQHGGSLSSFAALGSTTVGGNFV